HPGELGGSREKILLDELVVLGKKNPEPGMRVVPAHDALVRIINVLDLVDVLPRILGERHMGAGLRSVDSGNAGLHGHDTVAVPPDQHAADLGLHRRASVLPYLARDLTSHRDLRHAIGLASFFHAGSPAAETRSPLPNTAGASPAMR